MFIIILPILLLMLAFIVDVGLMYNAKIKGKSLLKEAVEENINIEEYFKINNIDIDNLKNKENCVIIEFRIESVFASIIGIKDYKIEVDNC